MSIAKRLINGSLASWFQILITVTTQILLVPVYLSKWDMKTYGVWITVQALSTLFTTIDIGHHTFLSFEFLLIGKSDTGKISRYLWSGVWFGFAIGAFQVVVLLILLKAGLLIWLLKSSDLLDKPLIHSAGVILILQSVTWWIYLSGGGLIMRVLAAFGYYPRVAWWTAFAMAITAIVPAVAVIYGAGLLQAAVAMAIASGICYTIQYIDLLPLLYKNKIGFSKSSWRLGWQNFMRSLSLSAKSILENSRNAGARIILAPLTGTVSLVTFTTLRTGANFAMQGLNSITYPMMPELIQFLNKRDQERSETALGTIWIIIIVVMAPAVIAVQTFIEPLFNLWTRGKVLFDPLLFSILSLSVLVYAIAQPAIAIVTGNNQLKIQLKIAAVSAVFVVAGMVLLVPHIGLLGAGIVLLTGEIITYIGYVIAAKTWLNNNGLVWPKKASSIVNRAILITAVGMVLIILFNAYKYILLAVALIGMFLNVCHYWRAMPPFARFHAKQLFRKISFPVK